MLSSSPWSVNRSSTSRWGKMKTGVHWELQTQIKTQNIAKYLHLYTNTHPGTQIIANVQLIRVLHKQFLEADPSFKAFAIKSIRWIKCNVLPKVWIATNFPFSRMRKEQLPFVQNLWAVKDEFLNWRAELRGNLKYFESKTKLKVWKYSLALLDHHLNLCIYLFLFPFLYLLFISY